MHGSIGREFGVGQHALLLETRQLLELRQSRLHVDGRCRLGRSGGGGDSAGGGAAYAISPWPPPGRHGVARHGWTQRWPCHGPEPARSESHGSSSCPRCPESITAGATHRGQFPATPRDVDLAHRVLGHAEKYAIVTHSPLPAVGAHSCPKSSPRRRVLAHSEVPSRSAIRSHLLRPTPGCRHRRCHGCPGRLSVGRRYLRPPHQQGPRPRHAWHVGALRHDLRRRRRQGQGCVRGSPVRRAHLPNLEDDQEAALRQVFSTE